MSKLDAISYAFVPLVYQFGRNWWILVWSNLALSLLNLPFLLFFMKESPKYLVSVS